ncbi:hypothetical protein GYMLUDRAFT_178605 [Collybiopsis luxurians FD-317 M1]|uniref:NACHT domain-containing protein n=1 Tax=Collybiopsis luxurians FD-317 M1 TaxID=944289 RepID=A0A0D0CFI7_9AGAR|nr:hypothetical protein GYMLUDRAFT_178605 [Collybiopsis luxurians FD-317 M1]
MLHLDNWPISHSALYDADAGAQISRRRCTENTRVDILKIIEDWVVDPSDDSPPIFWLRGMAGMGKSTIAYSICHHFDSQEGDHRLGASFFCSRQSENLRKRQNIIPTIVRRLAYYSAPFAEALSGIDPDMAYAVDKQLKNLLIEPWHKSAQKQLADRLPVLVVIDALDEIEGGQGSNFVSDLIQSLNQARASMHGIKFLITSRPDPNIVESCKQMGTDSTYRLEDVKPEAAVQDVRCFLGDALSQFPRIEAETLDRIATQSQGVFIYAATAVRYILPKPGRKLSHGEMHARVMAIVADRPVSEHLGDTELLIDTIYKQIIVEALEDPGTDVFKLRRHVLDTIAIAQEPISADTILQLVYGDKKDHDLQAVENAIGALHAVLRVSEKDRCVYIQHKSFLDFLLDPKRAGEQLACNKLAQHGVITQQCFVIMKSSLHFNMCALPSSYLLDAEVQGLKQAVGEKFNDTLRYACLWWTDHWIAGWEDRLGNLLMNVLEQFGNINAVFWIEAMNLLETSRRSYETMKRLREWFMEVSINLSFSICVNSVAFSNDGLRIVSGLSDNTVCIWDVDTGVKVQALEGHSGSVQSVAPSYDGSRIVSGSTDKSVCIWDVNTGMNLQTLEGHTGAVMSVAFSSDGSRIVSGSADNTIRIWDTLSGGTLQTIKGHTESFRSVAFSNDGLYIASGSSDQTVCIWDAGTGVKLHTLEGHKSRVWSVAFSYDGSRLVSGSDDEHICIWDAKTGENLLTLKGHTDWVRSVAFSNDGSRIISSSDDKTVCIWDASSGEKLQTLEGHNSFIYSVAFSSDGYHIVSGSEDHTICIWDVNPGVNLHTSPVKLRTLEGHTNWVRSVAFSSDSSRIVSGSYDNTVRIWDATIGVNLHTLEGHKDWVQSVAFSNDRSCIVSGSHDDTVHIWDANTGVNLQTLTGHTDCVQSVAFSNDGSHIVSGSDDKTICIWDAKTGVNLQTLEGHTDYVYSVAFSNDDSHIVSGSEDKTLRIWDASPRANVATSGALSNDVPLVPPKHLFTTSEREGGWLFDYDSSHPNHIVWLPPPLIESLPIYPCINILSRFGHTFVTYDPDFVGSNWMNCYNPTGTK